jgi:hypothetical protein
VRREDVPPLLEDAAGELPQADLADAAWAGGFAIRRRRRRSTAIALAVVLVIGAVAALAAGFGGGKANQTPPTTPLTTPPPVPPSTPAGFISPQGQIAGIDFWVAPPAGSERYLDRVATPLGDSLRVPEQPADLQVDPVSDIAAVLLARQRDGRYRPLLLDKDGHWAEAAVDLAKIRTGPPLSAAAVSPDGRFVAFPQPGELLLLDGATAGIRSVALPSHDLSAISWLPDGQRVLVTGNGAAYSVLAGPGRFGEPNVTGLIGGDDPSALTAPYRLEGSVGHVSLMQYAVSSGWVLQARLPLPATSWIGQAFTAGSRVARLFMAPRLPQVVTTASLPQVVAAISTQPSLPSRLLVLGETPAATPPPRPRRAVPDQVRRPGCCSVLGWYDEHTLLVRAVGKRSGWIVAWDLQTAEVRRVTQLEVDQVALGPGIHG